MQSVPASLAFRRQRRDTGRMMDRQFFGYGSLVNRATHGYPRTRPATLRGWQRVWVHTTLRPAAFLSVEPADREIDGLVAEVPGADWESLDAREGAYDRQPVEARLQTCGSPTPAQVYSVRSRHTAPPGVRHPLRLSYVDVVVQGYLEVFGEAGAERFFETTSGWRGPVHDDRAAPIYTRHQVLTSWQRGFVDAQLAARGATPLEGPAPQARPAPRG
ncbi:gamma-glutamylcyclotransferase family protein [Tropicimonas marinistellae]|uniref:gamma-glutamylcyclotransferase family protein n=1 Tax=Tropicimonas marinistellae TaxID=1739787 RepID=UPI000A54271A|nr:gamma-glutamylcyclotransferase family protein [Tropicimonas marinistellae]